ncbi:OmpA family protein [Tropicimonas sp. IMCC34043]|uniref:OmpA family protein n=1 Tax=Tropicimonas sp. IMCC34043 TaxID=2248760 RepID=UPI000E2455AA|nr:OmpA family protein [Tropicimonas sp. IMCC34043]
MRLATKFLTVAVLVLAAAGCWFAATVAAHVIEDRSGRAVSVALLGAGHEWTSVATDGLLVHLSGTAPTEAERFEALHIAGTVVDAARVIDDTAVDPGEPLIAPRYSMEILRNDDGITLIGLVPASLDRKAMASEIRAMADGAEVSDLLQTATYDEPEGWDEAVAFGLSVLARLPRSKVSIAPGQVSVMAISDSSREKQALEAALTRKVPAGVTLTHQISAPRPVITPFTLRFVIDDDGARFDACSADTPRARDRILAAAVDAGLQGQPDCTLGLGVPTPEWADAVTQGIGALAELGGGSLTITDADVSLVALEATPQRDFDRVVGELESNLPEVFSLTSVLPEPPTPVATEEGPPEFIATRSPEGDVQLRGRLNNALVRDTVAAYARSQFGVDAVHMAARIDETLPDAWPMRVLSGLQGLSGLAQGIVTVQADSIEISGLSGHQDAEAEISRLLSEKLTGAQKFRIDVSYDAAFDPFAALPTPQECIDKINAVLAAHKITFDPGSIVVQGDSAAVVDDIAEILKQCRKVDMTIEIAGHTDSQGREEMNLDLSQQRADAVLKALIDRRVLSSRISARGYGEAEPIADNKTEEGREANRRIEFMLVGEPAVPDIGDGALTGPAGGPTHQWARADAGATASGSDAGDQTGMASDDEAPMEPGDAAATEKDTE